MKALLMKMLSIVLILPSTVLAHGEKVGPNGGVVEDVGKYHVEVVMKADELRAFVTGAEGAKVDTRGIEASATVLVGREKLTLKLTPAGGNALAAANRFDPRAGAKVVVSLTLPGQPPASGRFSVPARN